jgi:hypothetical protein
MVSCFCSPCTLPSLSFLGSVANESRLTYCTLNQFTDMVTGGALVGVAL